ncbi:MAG: indole-3-glycerol phosphate synthase TrpC [Anaerolineae bacterium]|nr:indole-3-glycerol phosphate synthase TrpC [Anaerolineae bacterium]
MSAAYQTTDTVLDRILAHKVAEVAAQKQATPLAAVQEAAAHADPPRDFVAALNRDRVALIAEVKHASPSRGVLIEPFVPVELAQVYAANGAAAISVLTDARFFMGSLDCLRDIRAAVPVPVLRKDFIIDPYQVYEGRAAGADAVLLIVAALADGQLADLHALISELGMAALVEVHNEAEVARVLRLEPALLGINNRDLKTFDVDLGTTARLAAHIPAGVTLVAESGIFTAEDVRRVGGHGARAVLVGEALVKAQDTGALVRELSGQGTA